MEALAAGLYIIGEVHSAQMVMQKFKWGPSFMTLNREALDVYRKCANAKEVGVQWRKRCFCWCGTFFTDFGCLAKNIFAKLIIINFNIMYCCIFCCMF